MDINTLIKEAHENAVTHGWWEGERNVGMLFALMHSEISEALEEHRNHHQPGELYFKCTKELDCPLYEPGGKNNECIECVCNKPEGIPAELADVVIRIFDFCGAYGIDLEKAIKLKMAYNKTRPYRHGNKKA